MSFIVLKNVSYTYPGKYEPAVKNINLEMEKGEKVSITGLNGSGKSTLAKLMLGLLKPQIGEAFLDDKPLRKYSLPEIGQKIGYVSPNPGQMMFNTSVYNEIAFGLKWQGKTRKEMDEICQEYLKRFDLWNVRHEIPFNLSEGQKQLLVISAILVLRPDCLILDEPTKSIDTRGKGILRQVLNDIWMRGTGIVIVSHDKEFIHGFEGRNIRMSRGEAKIT